jgi:hypothetical protein
MRNLIVSPFTRGRLLPLSGVFLALSITGLATTKGPDAGGYTGTDETVYSFVDASQGGAGILTGSDDGTAALKLPFTFQFYGKPYSMVCVSSNGAVYFIAIDANCASITDFANTDLSNTAPSGNLPGLFPFWTDLTFDQLGAGSVFYKTEGPDGSRQFVVQWDKAFLLGSANPIAFEIILYETSNQIRFQYKTLGGANNGATATVGIRDAGSLDTGKQISWSFNVPVISDSSAILFIGNRAEPGISVTGGTFPYNGSPHGGSGFAYGAGGVGDVLTPPVTLSYEGTGGTAYPVTTIAPIGVGSYIVTAHFIGNALYNSASDTANLAIVPGSQSIIFTSVPPASPTVGGPTYTVTATGGASDNPVTFGSLTPGFCTVIGSVVSFTGAGTCQVAANQLGNENYDAAPLATQSMNVTAGGVTKLPNETNVYTSDSSTQFSETVIFAAWVHRGRVPIGTGTVTFKNGATVLAENVPVNGLGLAFFSTRSLGVGTHTILAFYNGTATDATSSGSLSQVVTKASTDTSLVSNPNPSNRNQNVTFTATVTHDGKAVTTGTVTFKEGAVTLGGPIALNSSGKASFSKSNLSSGTHNITAVYDGTSNYQTSSRTVTQTVRR